MTKEKLKKYRDLKLELEDVEMQINKLTVQDSVKGTSKYPPFIMQTHRIEGTTPENYGLLEYKASLKAEINEIEDFVDRIPNYKIRKAVRIYYLDEIEQGEDKPTWEDVADGFSGETGLSIKVKVHRFLRKC
ncbi:MAG: hypothetical protein ACI4JB_09955 [Porcipelethomonas sp.]